MVLTVVIAGNTAGNSTADSITIHSGPTSVFIVDTIGKIKCGGSDDTWADYQPPLSMWVRANGPEIFAGTAMLHMLKPSSVPQLNNRCTWRYDFNPKKAGDYSVHVKTISFNGFLDSPRVECESERVPPKNELFDRQKLTQSGQFDLEKLEEMNAEFVHQLADQGSYSHHRGLSGFKMYGE